MSQKDLFDYAPRIGSLAPSESVSAKTPFSFLEQTRISLRLDQVITLSIVLMVTMALIYTSGIEKGRRTAWHRAATAAPAAKAAVAAPAVTKEAAVSETAAKTTELPQGAGSQQVTAQKAELPIADQSTRPAKPAGPFTIQLVTYKEEALAHKKIESLQAKGLEGFLIPSGSYYQVCVNGFQKRQEAALSLTKLKSEGIAPKDAYIRMIPA